MKPRTKQQVLVYDLAQQMLALSAEQKKWAIANCTKHFGYANKSGIACMDCGVRFERIAVKGKCVCPNCKTTLEVTNTLKRNVSQQRYLGLIEVHGDFQVMRYFEINRYHKTGEASSEYIIEVISQWLLPNGKYEIVAKNKGMSYYCNSFRGSLEIRDRKQLSYKFDMIPDGIYPKIEVLPIYKRNGFDNNFHNISCFKFFNAIMNEPKCETLLKAKQHSLLSVGVYQSYMVNRYWSSIKVCLKNGYIVENATDWVDYLELLSYFGESLKEPSLICPIDLHKEHQIYVAKKRIHQEQQRLARQIRDELARTEEAKLAKRSIKKKDADYKKDKQAFLGMMFSDGEIVVKVLESIKDFKEEGKTLNHCVFENDYYNKKKSLVLSAQVNGKRTETVEVELNEMKIIQSRGLFNKPSEYNEKIVELVNKNLNRIRKTYKKSLKVA